MQSEPMQSEPIQYEYISHETMIKEKFIALITQINTRNGQSLRTMTDLILYNIFCVLKTIKPYLSLLYRLIFHTYKQDPLTACHILSGFIQFGQNIDGKPYKPLIDYFVIEAFNTLHKAYGWAILKPCLTALRAIHYETEPLYKHIVGCIVKQLNQDVNDMLYTSDVCCHLPREKSFTWGWFSYEIARAYYAILLRNKKELTAKDIRNIMMLYRKLLTKLRQNVSAVVRITSEPTPQIDTNWNSILTVLADYKWASDIIDKTLNDDEPESASASASEVVASANEAVAVVASEAVVASASEAVAVVANEAAPVAAPEAAVKAAPVAAVKAAPEAAVKANEVAPELHPSEKNNSWLYKLFGW
jgi:hypothetical protein